MLFGMLPPEINSGLMYAGPGSGPMMGAATAWSGLAADLYSTAASCQSMISGLTDGPWQGPSAVRMAAAAAPYVTWMDTTAAQAEWAASQAKLAAGAFETAHAMTVPPAVVAANRALLMSLIATNFFGQNTPAIAVTEMHYAEMWAQDALAMSGYAATGGHAAVLPSFTPPPLTTAGPGAQVAAGAQSPISFAGAHALATLSQLTAATPDMLQALSSGSSGSSVVISQAASFQNGFLSGIGATFTAFQAVALPVGLPAQFEEETALAGVSSATILHGVQPFLNAGFAPQLSGLASQPVVSVGLGHANMIGPLSVPPSWAGHGPAMGRAAPVLPNASVSAPSVWAPGGPFGQSLLGNMAGEGLRGIASSIPKVKAAAPAHR
jgi:PPE-repeat protein